MGGDKPPRHVAVALVYDVESHRLLMVSSRAHPGMWIRELDLLLRQEAVLTKSSLDASLRSSITDLSYLSR